MTEYASNSFETIDKEENVGTGVNSFIIDAADEKMRTGACSTTLSSLKY